MEAPGIFGVAERASKPVDLASLMPAPRDWARSSAAHAPAGPAGRVQVHLAGQTGGRV